MQSSILRKSTDRVDLLKQLLDKVYGIARDVPWLRQECGMTLCDLAIDLEPLDYANSLLEKLVEYDLVKTPEGVAIWLAVRSKWLDASYPPNVWHNDDPLHRKEMRALADVLKEGGKKSQPEDEDAHRAAKTGTWYANANFAWGRVFRAVLARCASSTTPDIEHFQRVWTHIVDENLFSQSSSDERKFWGLQIFSTLVLSAPEWALPALFSQNLMRCIINQRADKTRALYDAAAEPLKKIQARVRRYPFLASVFIKNLTTGNGTILFDRTAKSKLVEELLSAADNNAALSVVQLFEALISQPQADDEPSAETIRQGIADLLLNAARNRTKKKAGNLNLGPDLQWLLHILQTFSQCAYCIPAQSSAPSIPIPPISNKSRNVFRARLSSLLAHLIGFDKDINWPGIVVDHIRVCAEDSGEWRWAVKLHGDARKTLEKTLSTLADLGPSRQRDPDDSERTNYSLKLLLSLATLQVFGEDPDAISILEELHESKVLQSVKEDGTQPAERVIVEVLLSFISQPSTLFRKIAERVFGAITSLLTRESMASLIVVLERKESVGGQDELFDKENEIEDETEGVEVDSDVEIEEADDSSESEGQSTDNGESESELLRFDTLLAETLGTSRPDTQIENEDDSSDGSDMDDDQMMVIEPHLAKIFQQRRAASGTNKKKEQREAKENMINFKCRVLDLLEIFVKQEHESCLAFDIIHPLLRLMRETSSPQVANRASDTLKTLSETCSKHKSYPEPPRDDIDGTWKLLHAIHSEARQQASKHHDMACSRASLFVVKCLLSVNRDHYHDAARIYAETQNDWFRDPKVNIDTKFFTEWVSWSAEMRKSR